MDTLRKLWSQVSTRTGSSDRSNALSDLEIHEHTVALLGGLLDSCPACKEELPGHSYTLIATAVFDQVRANSAYHLFSALSARHWDQLASYREWEGAKDDVLVYALRCPSGRISVLIIEDPQDLFYNKKLMQSDVLDPEESRKLEAVAPEKEWRLMSSPVNAPPKEQG